MGTSVSSIASWVQTLTRAWQADAGPGDGCLVVDIGSFDGEVHGRAQPGAAFGFTRVRGHDPIVATRADTGELLHIRRRKGSANTSAYLRATNARTALASQPTGLASRWHRRKGRC